jgi:hypothetical protein
MRIYTVHELKGAPADGEGLVFVHEGFSWPAFLVPLVWLVYRRLWLALLLYFLANVALVGAAALAGLGETGLPILALTIQYVFACEANDVRRWTLSLKGYREIGLASGRTLVEAEREFFRSWRPSPEAPRQSGPRMEAPAGAVWPRRPVAEEGPIGLFPKAGG